MDRDKILESKKREDVFKNEEKLKHKLLANEWAIGLASLVFILLMILSYLKSYDITSAKILFLSIILGNRLYVILKNRDYLSVTEKATSYLILIGGVVMFIGFIGDLISN